MNSDGVAGLARRIHLRKTDEAKAASKLLYDKELDEITANVNKNQEEYDKQLLTLSSGFLVLSMAFIKDIVPNAAAIHRWMLYSSFATLAFCVFAVLASFQLSNEGHYKAKEFYEDQKDGGGLLPFPYKFANAIKYLNWFTGGLFVVGIFLTTCFVITNLSNEATSMSNRTSLQEGQQMRVPSAGEGVHKGANVKAPPPPPPKQQPPPPPKK